MTRRLSAKIQSNQAAYLKHLCEIELLHECLADSTALVTHCRRDVGKLKGRVFIFVITNRGAYTNLNKKSYGLKLFYRLERLEIIVL